ncbi:MAG: DUF2079 domain-containing protein, partial [Candidatus Eremiobacteraeota bacterium]|nr:DUF2079 domain-containing protein [Candidatus Eremiobacteraeota bacterium]
RFHWAPLLAVLWPFVAVARQGLVLQLAQAALVGASAIPLYALARHYLTERVAFALAGLLLLYPPLLAVAFTEFHEIAFYPLVTFALFWASDRARWGAFAAFAGASALVREEACIVYAIAGLAFVALGIAAARDDSRAPRGSLAGAPRGLLAGAPLEPRGLVAAGLGLVVVNCAALAIYYGLVTPRLGGWEPGAGFYSYPFATGPLAVVAALIAHPANVATLLTFGRLTYLLEAFAPLAFLPFFSRWSLLALPGLLIVLLSSSAITWRMGSHYAAIWVPWLFIGICAVLARWQRERRYRRVRIWPRVATGICIVVLIAFDPLHPAHYARAAYPIDADVRHALATIPPNARVALHDEWFTHVATRHPYATVFFCPYLNYLVYADDYPNDYFQTQILPEMRAERASGQIRLLRRFGKVGVYARTPDRGAIYGRCLTARPEGFKTLREFMDYDLRGERATRY